jgi:hypothetical protein
MLIVGGSLVGFNGPHCATSMSFGGRPPHLKFVSLGDGVDQPVSSAKDAPLVTLGTSGIAGSRISVHVNRDIALPAFPAAQPKGTDTK